MEVLANGFKANFWIPVEDEPDIDRFVDEQIMIDLDRFMIVGTLEKVSTCKKKNEEKEFEYFKQLTVQVNNICMASDNNVNIQIPGKKDEFLYPVAFRYAPEPTQDAAADPVEAAAAEAELEAKEKEQDEQTLNGDHESPSLEEIIEANEALPEEAASEIEQTEAESHTPQHELDGEADLGKEPELSDEIEMDNDNEEAKAEKATPELSDEEMEALFDEELDADVSGHNPDNPEPEPEAFDGDVQMDESLEPEDIIDDPDLENDELDDDGINWGD